MNADEAKIFQFLESRGDTFVAATEVSKKLGTGRRAKDRMWARPILQRMEMDGLVESNAFGEYRVRLVPPGGIDFKEALNIPGTTLGDTTIIRVEGVT